MGMGMGRERERERRGMVLPLDHQCLDMVNRMYILDALLHNATYSLETFEPTHRRHCVALYHDIASGEQLKRLFF